jgi:hypothetical protein
MSRPVCVQRTGRRTEIAYKAQSPGELAPRNKAQGSGDRVMLRLCSGSLCPYPGRPVSHVGRIFRPVSHVGRIFVQ